VKTITPTIAGLVARLFTVTTAADIEAILADVPDARWRQLGDTPGNYALVNVGSDAADALIERVTNGMDAVLEREVELRGERNLDSPRQAAEKLLGVPGGHVWNMRDKPGSKRDDARRALAEQVRVTLREGTRKEHPTVVVEDTGIGQHPDDFPKTLTSLNQDNKRDKFYLLGAYGWGGASVYAFGEYTLVVSRRNPALRSDGQGDKVGWTIVRYNDLSGDRNSKTGVYEYLVVAEDSEPRGVVPRFEASELPPTHRDWSGASITMVDFRLDRYVTEPTWRAGRSLWVLAGALMMDPVMPFLIRDERPRATSNLKSALDGLVINGAATRLTEARGRRLEYAEASGVVDSTLRDTEKISLNGAYHHDLTTGGGIDIRWWVIGEKGNAKKDWEPISSYVPPDQAITVCHNGQRHESYTRLALEKLSLLSLSKFMVVQIDTDKLTWQEKRWLFASTRQALKGGTVEREVLDALATALRDDDLRQEERRRKERALARRSKDQAERVMKRLAKAVAALREGMEQKFKIVMSANAELPLFTDQPLADSPGTEPPEPAVSVAPILYSGEPTFIRVLNGPISLPAGGRAVVRLSIDAPDDFFADHPGRWLPVVSRGRESFAVVGYSDVRSGRMRATVAARSAEIGEKGRIIFMVVPGAPEGHPIMDEVDITTVEPPAKRQKRVKPAGMGPGKEAGPDVQPIGRDQWAALGFEADGSTVAKVEPNEKDSDMLTIYVNVEYPPLDRGLMARPRTDDEAIDEFKDGFAAHMALLAWLQHSQKNGDVQQDELQRAAMAWVFSNLG
jgi:hypothetical protein